jgi:Tol biopolymer transport system component
MGTILSAVAAAAIAVAVGPAAGQQSYGSQIYSVRVDGRGLVNLSGGRGSDWLPSVSPDGGRIAFLRNPGPVGAELWVMNADGSEQRRLAGSVSLDSFTRPPSWSPDGRSIAFVGSLTGGASGLLVIGADGSGARRLGDAEAGPVWSPDGRLLAFDTFDSSNCGPLDRNCARALLTVVRPDGSGRKVLAEKAIWPSWSPAGKRLAFAGEASGTDVAEIEVVSAGGGLPRRIVPSSAGPFGAPAWSPSGRSIAFVGGLAVRRQSLYLVAQDGTRLRRLAGGRGSIGGVAWSPTGRRLAYAFRRNDRGPTSIWTMRSDGSHRRRLTRVGGRAVVFTLAWSRAGRLVFVVP